MGTLPAFNIDGEVDAILAAPFAKRTNELLAFHASLKGKMEHHDPVRLVNQRMSGKESARGKERTDFKKPATCGGKAIS